MLSPDVRLTLLFAQYNVSCAVLHHLHSRLEDIVDGALEIHVLRLAEQLGCHHVSLRRALDQLEDDGHIRELVDRRRYGHRTYHLANQKEPT